MGIVAINTHIINGTYVIDVSRKKKFMLIFIQKKYKNR